MLLKCTGRCNGGPIAKVDGALCTKPSGSRSFTSPAAPVLTDRASRRGAERSGTGWILPTAQPAARVNTPERARAQGQNLRVRRDQRLALFKWLTDLAQSTREARCLEILGSPMQCVPPCGCRVGACLGPSARSSRRGLCSKGVAVTMCHTDPCLTPLALITSTSLCHARRMQVRPRTSHLSSSSATAAHSKLKCNSTQRNLPVRVLAVLRLLSLFPNHSLTWRL